MAVWNMRSKRLMVIVITVLGLGIIYSLRPSHRTTRGPLSLCFLRYTNHEWTDAAFIGLSERDEAVFELTNHTPVPLSFKYSIDGAKMDGRGVSTSSSGGGLIPGHAATYLPIITPSGTNGWRFEVHVAATGPRPPWQRRMGSIITKVGFDAGFLRLDRKYREVTNVWDIP